MKKILLFLAVSAAFVSCEKKLADNEYEITGKIADEAMNGKNVILEKQGGYTGYVPVDTATVEKGKFIFKGTVTEPSLHFISFQDNTGEKANFILESGRITLDVDKDTIYNSVQGGTFNNEKLSEYTKAMKANNDKMTKFQKDNTPVMMEAREKQDTATMERLNDEYEIIAKESEAANVAFIKENPKAYINVFILQQLMGSRTLESTELKELYNTIDPEVKETEEGKKLSETFTAMEEKEKNRASVSNGNMAPDFAAPNPEGKTISLKEAMGKVTIIDFWASWCKPCRMENPNVVAMYEELHKDGLNIIGVSLDRDEDAWKKAIADDNLTWSQISNLKFWEEPIAKKYGVESIPATFILDADGKIAAQNLRGEELKAKVKELLAQ
ncbi:TlpA disulfide reductase family protein [Flavobacterium litorale]|uniref:AhpC/TSA family protein n=1 Tax=Flavobacterium litorale TaxID=2856519 RepID=A0ABX8V415_9FLAO|nr:TlpA disulfide reductase family protein [Flavobacterium litorale]QYJ67590.1 AhpC/TSA family protein [Flavobacterium litorale]